MESENIENTSVVDKKIKHREQIKAWIQRNREHVRQQKAEYNILHRDKTKEYNKLYYDTKKNTDDYKQRYQYELTCSCGKTVQRNNLHNHQQTKFHMKHSTTQDDTTE